MSSPRDRHAARRRRWPAVPASRPHEAQAPNAALAQSMDAVGHAAGRALRALGHHVGLVVPVVELTRWFVLVDGAPEHGRAVGERAQATLRAVERTGARASHEALAVPRAPADAAVHVLTGALAALREAAPRNGLVYVMDASRATDRYALLAPGGVNLLAPGLTPGDHLRFLFFCGAFVRALAGRPGVDLGRDLESILQALARGEMFAGSDEERATRGAPSLPPVARAGEPPYAFTGAGFTLGRLDASSLTQVNLEIAAAIVEQTCALEAWLAAGEDREPAVREVVADSYRRHRGAASVGTRSVNSLP